MANAQALDKKAKTAGELAEALRLARDVADSNPQSREAQYLVAQIAYRASRYAEVVSYMRRGGDPGESQPTLLFYLAVAQYETGDREAARQTLSRCLPRLAKTPFVERYSQAILAAPTP
jgi:hypothetical protein